MKNNPNLEPEEYFGKPENAYHKQYRAMMDFYYNKMTAAEVAEKHGYTVSTVYSMSRDLKAKLNNAEDPYFKTVTLGRKLLDEDGTLTSMIVALRKNYLSVPEIKSVLEATDINVSLLYIDAVLKKEGFARLHRRDNETKQETKIEIPEQLLAEKTRILDFSRERFTSQLAGLLCFLPFIKCYELDKAIAASAYPETKLLNRSASIYAFLALKLSNIKRYSADDLWCMDLFAGLNVLPKTAWFSSYSSAVKREMNIDFLKSLHKLWHKNGLLSDTANTLRHDNQDEAILEFLDFHQEGAPDKLKYLVFDSKFTTYQNLDKLNKQHIMFVTIRRYGAKLVERINKLKVLSGRKSKSNGPMVKAAM